MPEDAWPHSRRQYQAWQFLSSLSVLAASLGRSRREPSVVPASPAAVSHTLAPALRSPSATAVLLMFLEKPPDLA